MEHVAQKQHGLANSYRPAVNGRDNLTRPFELIYLWSFERMIAMKNLALLAAVSQLALSIGSGAEAADLPAKAPPMAAPAYSWTGCYVGGHVGAGWNHHDVHDTNFSFGPGGTPIAGTAGVDSSGGIYGGQVGCNYQFASYWLIGIQGDIAGANIRGQVADPASRFFNPPPSGPDREKTDMIASVTGRLGATAFDNRALFYVKGGIAWDRNRWDFSQSAYCQQYGCIGAAVSDRRTGWTIGGGVEWVLSPSWSNLTAFGEYNYYDFGSDGTSFQVGRGFFDPRNAISTEKQTVQTFKLGLNYKLFGY